MRDVSETRRIFLSALLAGLFAWVALAFGATITVPGVMVKGMYRSTQVALNTNGDESQLLTGHWGELRAVTGAISPIDSGIPVYGVSNGATPQTLLAGVAGQRIFIDSLLLANTSTTAGHTVVVASSGGMVVAVGRVGSNGTGVLGENGGTFRSGLGEGLVFYFTDGAGAVGDMIVTGSLVQKGTLP